MFGKFGLEKFELSKTQLVISKNNSQLQCFTAKVLGSPSHTHIHTYIYVYEAEIFLKHEITPGSYKLRGEAVVSKDFILST